MNKQLSTKVKIAKYTSYLLDPVFLSLVILVTSIVVSGMPQNVMIGWIIGVLVLNALIPAIFYFYFISKGYVFDDSLSNKNAQKERIIMFLIVLAMVAIELIILVSTQIYQPLFAVLVGGIVTIIIASVISYFWKISVHASVTTFFVAMIILLFGFSAWPVALAIPAVMWSRLVLNRHTIYQLLAGFTVSLIIVLVTFNYFNLLN